MRLTCLLAMMCAVSWLGFEPCSLAKEKKGSSSTSASSQPPSPPAEERKPDKGDEPPRTTCVKQTNGEWRCGPC
jgi:hypothetical protein